MKQLLLLVWCALPVAALAYHLGPGQERMKVDRAAALVARGEKAAAQAQAIGAQSGDDAARDAWAEAEQAYGEALALLPAGEARTERALRLERAKAQMFVSHLPEAHQDLTALVDEMANDPGADQAVLADARGALASAQYYLTWLMRLEGAPREQWEPEIEASRQNYKLLAEHARRGGDGALAQKTEDNLEAAIRLARLDLADLQGLPLPSQ
ncbi:MAG: hypothetical protein U1E76_09675 [Planctomycetota bacterium]